MISHTQENLILFELCSWFYTNQMQISSLFYKNKQRRNKQRQNTD